MTREEALIIAKSAYKSIESAIFHFECEDHVEVGFGWDGCIQVDEHFFTERELHT